MSKYLLLLCLSFDSEDFMRHFDFMDIDDIIDCIALYCEVIGTN